MNNVHLPLKFIDGRQRERSGDPDDPQPDSSAPERCFTTRDFNTHFEITSHFRFKSSKNEALEFRLEIDLDPQSVIASVSGTRR